MIGLSEFGLIVGGFAAGFSARGLMVKHCTARTVAAAQWLILAAITAVLAASVAVLAV